MENSLWKKFPGLSVQLGYLYDARNEKMTNLSIFNTTQIPESMIQSTDADFTRYEHTLNDSYEEKFRKLNVSAELTLDILSGQVKLHGSGAYLGDDKEHYKSIKGTVLLEVKTVNQSLNILDKKLKPLINFDALNNKEATHVIVGINWGANAIASFEYKNKESKNKTEIEGKFDASISKIKALSKLEAKADVKYQDEEIKILHETNIKFKADIVPENELPQTVEETLNLFKKIPTYIKDTNNGKGVPLEFKLLSLDEISRLFEIEIECHRVLKKINLEVIRSIEIEFDKLLEQKQKLNDLIEDCEVNDRYLNDEHKKYLSELKGKISINENIFKQDISMVLFDVRAGLKEPVEILEKMEKFQKSGYSSSGIDSILKSEKCQTIVRKIQFLKRAKDSKIEIFDKYTNNVKLFVNSESVIQKEVYIIKTSDKLKQKNEQLNDDYWDYFLSLKRTEDKQVLFYLFDYEISNEYKEEILCIEYYKKGRKIESDCFKIEVGTVKPNEKIPFKLMAKQKPKKTVCLMIRCPNSECPRNRNKWKCEDCKKDMEYDESLEFYCDCGSNKFEIYEYKCTSNFHPEHQYATFKDLKDLREFLQTEFYKVFPLVKTRAEEDKKEKSSVWKFLNDKSSFENYDDLSNGLLEDGFLKGQKSFNLKMNNFCYLIDFVNFTQTNILTKKVREIKRVSADLKDEKVIKKSVIWASQNAKNMEFDKLCLNDIKKNFDVKVIDSKDELISHLNNLNKNATLIISGGFFIDCKANVNKNSYLTKVLVLTRNKMHHKEDLNKNTKCIFCTSREMVVKSL